MMARTPMVAASPDLAQQIPAPVAGDMNQTDLFALVVQKRLPQMTALQLMLLFDEAADLGPDLIFVQGCSCR
jgi:hypothetical protein